jgi:hypothetical protein
MMRKTVALTKTEIIAELKKLGINTPSELHSCLWEYENYALQNNFSFLSTRNSRLNRKLSLKRKFEKVWNYKRPLDGGN